MAMYKRVLIILLCAIFYGQGQLLFAKMIESQKSVAPSRRERLERVQARVNELNAKLNLSEEQKKAITGILTNTKDEVAKLFEAAGTKIGELKEKSEEAIKSVLTKEQRDKLDEVAADTEEEGILKIFRGQY